MKVELTEMLIVKTEGWIITSALQRVFWANFPRQRKASTIHSLAQKIIQKIKQSKIQETETHK